MFLNLLEKRQANYDRKASSILMVSQYLGGIKQTSVFRILMLQQSIQLDFLSVNILLGDI